MVIDGQQVIVMRDAIEDERLAQVCSYAKRHDQFVCWAYKIVAHGGYMYVRRSLVFVDFVEGQIEIVARPLIHRSARIESDSYDRNEFRLPKRIKRNALREFLGGNISRGDLIK